MSNVVISPAENECYTPDQLLEMAHAESVVGPKIAQRLTEYISSFADNPADALKEFKGFMLTVYDNLFGSITFYKALPPPDADEARSLAFLILRYTKGNTPAEFAKHVVEQVYDMYGSRYDSRSSLGIPKIKYHGIYNAFSLGMLADYGWERHTVNDFTQSINMLLDCFEYPNGHK